MKRIIGYLALFCFVCLIVGCEDWEGVDSEDAWNDAQYGWVDLTGLYRNPQGGALVVSYTVTPGDAPSTNTVSGEILAYGVFAQTTYSGTANNNPVGVGSFTISAGGFVFTDNGDGTLTGTAGTTGAIDYGTGAWSFDLGSMSIGAGVAVIGSYQYTVGGSAGEVKPGSSKTTIYSLLVEQMGNLVVLTDSDGYSYTGRLETVSSSSGATQQGLAAGVVTANFEARGRSKGNVDVRITGVFTGVYTATEDSGGGGGNMVILRPTRFVLSGRTMRATWIELNSSGKITKTGDVVGSTWDVETTITTDVQTDLSI